MNAIFKSAMALSALSVITKLLSPAKNVLIANKFGVSRKLDAYFLCQNLTDVVVATFSFTIIIVAVPAFVEELASKRKGERKPKLSIDSFINQNMLFSVLLAATLFVLSERLGNLMPGFSEARERVYLSHFLRLFSLVLVFSVPFTALTGFWYCVKGVVLPSFLNIIPVICVILSIVLLSGVLDIYSIPAGVLVGSCLVYLLIFAMYLSRGGGFNLTIKDTTIIRNIKSLILPTMVFSAGGHINLLIDQLVTSSIKDGAISILSYAQLLFMVPFSIITVPLVTALFPEMSKRHFLEGRKTLTDMTAKGMVLLIAIMVPLSVFIMLFRVPLIELFYNHGKFELQSVRETAWVLFAYGPAVVFLSVNNLLQRVFFSKKAMYSLMILTLVSILLNIILDIYFSSIFSIPGIALATSVNEIVYFVLILFTLQRHFQIGLALAVQKELFQVLISACAMATVLFVTQAVFPPTNITNKIHLLFCLASYFCLGFSSYVFLMKHLFGHSILGRDSVWVKNE